MKMSLIKFTSGLVLLVFSIWQVYTGYYIKIYLGFIGGRGFRWPRFLPETSFRQITPQDSILFYFDFLLVLLLGVILLFYAIVDWMNNE
jgi:hypothetical protein